MRLLLTTPSLTVCFPDMWGFSSGCFFFFFPSLFRAQPEKPLFSLFKNSREARAREDGLGAGLRDGKSGAAAAYARKVRQAAQLELFLTGASYDGQSTFGIR